MKEFTEAGTIVFLFTIAEWLESRASHKATAVMSSLMSITPQKAVIAETGEEVDADQVKLGTIVAVKTGEVVPIDGIVVEGKCEVDEKTLTGESFPVPKQPDSTVWAGTINLNGYISVRTTALAEDCVVAKMAKLVEESQNSKSNTQRFIDKCALYYTPTVIIISASVAVIPMALNLPNRKHWFNLALVVLVSACPCALILSTPVATFCALTKAATCGLLIKGGDHLEVLAKIKIMAFDKTGTITRGEFAVTDFQSLSDDISSRTLLYWVSSIESKSSHPMASAIVGYSKSLSIEPKPENVEEFQNYPGEGIHGKIDGKSIYIGNRRIAVRAGCITDPSLEGDIKKGHTIGYVYAGEIPIGIFSLSDVCRSGVVEAIKKLKSLGIKTAMLTGDSQAAAMHTQEQLKNALDLVHAELLPEAKAEIIKGFKDEGPTAMIGDGVNDAPALAIANVGISMGISGSALATETGHVILMSNDIRKVPKAIQLAKKARRKIIENVFLSISTKIAILVLAFAGHPLVWAAVLADTGTCLLVIFNSMLLLRGTDNHGGKCCKSATSPHVNKHGSCNSRGNSDSSHGSKSISCSVKPAPYFHKHESNNHHDCCSEGKALHPDHGHETAGNWPPSLNPHKQNCCCSKNPETDCIAQECSSQICGSGCSTEADHCHHGSTDHHHHDLEAQISCDVSCSGPHKSSSCSKDKPTSSVSDELHAAKCCYHNHSGIESLHSSPDHSNHYTDLEQDQNVLKNTHCKSSQCCKDRVRTCTKHEITPNIVESCCNHHYQLDKLSQTTIDILPSPSEVATLAKQACMCLEKRQMRACCKSYMEECCGQQGNFAARLGGCLSEIVAE